MEQFVVLLEVDGGKKTPIWTGPMLLTLLFKMTLTSGIIWVGPHFMCPPSHHRVAGQPDADGDKHHPILSSGLSELPVQTPLQSAAQLRQRSSWLLSGRSASRQGDACWEFPLTTQAPGGNDAAGLLGFMPEAFGGVNVSGSLKPSVFWFRSLF